MVAIAIMGIAVVTIVTAMGAGILLATRHRQQTTANTVLVTAAEAVKASDFDTNCPATYSPPGKSGYSVATSVAYLDDAGATVDCSTGPPLQKVTVTVTGPDGFVTSVDVVKRNNT
jgi:hypothetical protein